METDHEQPGRLRPSDALLSLMVVAGCASAPADRASSPRGTPHAAGEPTSWALFASETGEAPAAWSGAAPQLEASECTPFRAANVGGAQGDPRWEGTSRWRVYRCAQPVLAALRDSGYAEALVRAGGRLIEGTLAAAPGDSSAPVGSESIVKVSYFNDIDPEGRASDLAKLSSDAAGLADTWSPDAQLVPTASLGVARPDAIDFIYYREAGQGQRFRDANPDILQRIGAFNTGHTTAFTYIGGMYTH